MAQEGIKPITDYRVGIEKLNDALTKTTESFKAFIKTLPKKKWGKKRLCFWCREWFLSQRTYNRHVSGCMVAKKEPKWEK